MYDSSSSALLRLALVRLRSAELKQRRGASSHFWKAPMRTFQRLRALQTCREMTASTTAVESYTVGKEYITYAGVRVW